MSESRLHGSVLDETARTAFPLGREREIGGEYQRMFSSFLDNSDVSSAILDDRLRVLAANRELLTLFGRSAAEVCQADLPTLLHPFVSERVQRRLSRLVLQGERGFRERFTPLVPAAGGLPVTLIAAALPGRGPGAVLLLFLPDRVQRRTFDPAGRTRAMSEIETQILQGIAAGASTAELARRLYLSRQGVEYHIHRMLRGLKVRNRTELVSRAYVNGLLAPDVWPPQVLAGRPVAGQAAAAR
ncbi:LuxR C-terminal-related transcriptional regulator [Amycolatopsis sp. NPDC004378]